jgi:anti-sigma regulatory factor (Ser/Thr protein kinase)
MVPDAMSASSVSQAAGSRARTPLAAGAPFRHEALFYADGDRGFVDGTLALVRRALATDAAVLVAVAATRAAALAQALGEDAERVRFADISRLGRNPARIIPMWRDFALEHASGSRGGATPGTASAAALGIAEPVWAERDAEELIECERHEALLNLAFDDGAAWHLLCPYDIDGLDDDVLESARHTHPLLACDGASRENREYPYVHEPPRPFAGALPAPRHPVRELAFAHGELAEVRQTVAGWASANALAAERTEELVLAVDELASNSIRHGGGAGMLRWWREGETLLCEVRDAGWIQAPLVGRVRPNIYSSSGRGVWLVNQLCDLVQIRSAPAGSVVRVHMRLG